MFLNRMNGSFGLPNLREDFGRTFGDLFETVASAAPFGVLQRGAFPALNVWDNERQLHVEAEVPGMTMDDIEVLVQRNELTIRGQRKENNREGATFHRRERGVGEFSRVVQLPCDVNSEGVTASIRDGVLSITMPKAEAAIARKIKVSC